MRAWKSPSECVELDDVLEESKKESTSVSIVLPKGCSMRDAMKKIHHDAMLYIKQIQLVATQKHIAVLKPRVTRQAFVDSCNAYQRDESEKLGLEDGVVVAPNKKLAMQYAMDVYTRTITRVREVRSKFQRDKEKNEREQAEKVEKLAKAKPSNILLEF
eukprot:2535888-Lingulodinium_polyedra.AAC.2